MIAVIARRGHLAAIRLFGGSCWEVAHPIHPDPRRKRDEEEEKIAITDIRANSDRPRAI